MGLKIILVNFYYMPYLTLNLLKNYKSENPFFVLCHKKEPTKENGG